MTLIAPRPYQPDVAVPPGATIRDMLAAKGMSQVQFAKRMDRPTNKINEIIQGKRAITADTAIRLEITLGLPASFWLEREKAFTLTKARLKAASDQESQAPQLKDFPVAAMVRLGWIEKAATVSGRIRELQSFFGVASLAQLDSKALYGAAFRKAESRQSSPYALTAWLRKGELLAAGIETAPYSPAKFRNAVADQFRPLTMLPANTAKERLLRLCMAHGIALVIVPTLPKSFVSGAAYWLGEKPVIQMSCRFNGNDHFWFNFFHEVGHILLHKGKCFLDDFKPNSNAMEKEADEFAQTTLIPESSMRRLLQSNYKDSRVVREFAESIRLAPGVVVGRLQHEDLLLYSQMNFLKESIMATQ